MTRAQQTMSILLILASIYISCYIGLVPLSAKFQGEIVPIVPFWSMVTFGAYLLFKLGYGILTFNDVPEAHKELMGQIKQAREDLRAKGVDVG